MNPCECGYFGDPLVECRCTSERIARYRARASGPLAERIDLHIEVPRQTAELLRAPAASGEASAVVQARVAAVHARQHARQGQLNGRLRVEETVRQLVRASSSHNPSNACR